jgi:hypothetical protein
MFLAHYALRPRRLVYRQSPGQGQIRKLLSRRSSRRLFPVEVFCCERCPAAGRRNPRGTIDAVAISPAPNGDIIRQPKGWVLRNLRRNAVLTMRAGDRSAAARPIELIGKHLGMFVDRKQVEISYIDDADEYLARVMALVDAKVVEHEPPAIDNEPAEPDESVH